MYIQEGIVLGYCQQVTGSRSFSTFIGSFPREIQLSINILFFSESPLNSSISDQIRRSTEGKIKATVFKVRKTMNSANLELEYNETNPTLLKDVRLARYMYDLVFTHPESVSCCKKGLELFQSSPYQRSVQAVAVDEAHCILER